MDHAVDTMHDVLALDVSVKLINKGLFDHTHSVAGTKP